MLPTRTFIGVALHTTFQMAGNFPDIVIPEGAALRLERIANRYSFPYVKTYGLGKMSNLRTVVRGTLRFVIPQRFASNCRC